MKSPPNNGFEVDIVCDMTLFVGLLKPQSRLELKRKKNKNKNKRKEDFR